MKLPRICFVSTVLLGWILFQAGAAFARRDRPDIQQRETVLDRIIHIEKDLLLEVPDVPRWCDRLELKKSRVNVGDCELYVEEEGSGVPVVLLHGGPGGTHHGFHPEFSRQKTFARLIYYDQRGCGLSDYQRGPGYTISQAVDDLEHLRKALQIERWIVLGWSYGGLLAQRYALEYPESVSGLILVASGTGMPPKKMGANRQHDYISPEEKQRIAEVSAAVALEGKKRGWSREKTMELLIYNRHMNGDWKRQHYCKPTPEQFAMGALYEWKQDTDFNAVMSQDQRRLNLKGAFENCPIPTLIFEAKWDLTWMPEKVEELSQNHPGARLVVLEQAGHVLFRDEPEKFFGELKRFIEAMPPVSGDEIARWKKYLADWRKNQVDPLLSSPMSEAEAKNIAEFHEISNKIKAGETYEDLSTPFRAFLSFLCAVHQRNPEALKRIQIGDQPYSSQDLESWKGELASLDILRAPLPPEKPEPGTMWPVFLKDPAANTLVDTHLFGFWQGQWIRTGNMGGPADWRPFAEKMKDVFIDLIRKKVDAGQEGLATINAQEQFLQPPVPSPDPKRLVGDKLKVIIPKNLSLFHIIVLLTPSAEKMKDRFPHPLAQKAREYFAPYRKHPAVELADKIFKNSWYFPFNYLAFFFSDVPEAELRQDIELPAEAQKPEFKALAFDFVEKARDFYAVARFEEFWQRLKTDLEKILVEAAGQLQQGVPAPDDPNVRYPRIDFARILESFFGRGAERYYFVPCIFTPFAATHAEVQVKKGNPSYYYLQGGGLLPKAIYTYYFAIHEFSHCFLGPVSEKYAQEIEQLKDLYVPLKATFPSKGYRTWGQAFDEHLNEAIQLWLIGKAFGDKAMNYFRTYELDKDFKLIEHFFAAVKDYDQRRDVYKNMEAYYPEILRRLSRIKVEPFRRPDRMGFEMETKDNRILVKSVLPESAFGKAGIRGGDLVVGVGPDAVYSVETFNAAKLKWWNTAKEEEFCLVTILRDGKKIELKVEVPFVDDFRYAEAVK